MRFLIIAAGAVIDEEVLIEELDRLDISRNRIIVDPRAVLVSEQDKIRERETRADFQHLYRYWISIDPTNVSQRRRSTCE